jgi:hypothetical protein
VTQLGVFDGPASALAAIDALDAPGADDPDESPCGSSLTDRSPTLA